MKRSIACLLMMCAAGTCTGSALGAAGEPPLAVSPQALYSPPTWGPSSGDEAIATPTHEGGGPKLSDSDPFTCGAMSFEFMTGYFPRTKLGAGGAIDSYLPQALRVGLMCNDPHPDWWVCKGVYEMMLEYNASPIVKGPGNYFTGPCAILRYNWVWSDCCIVPYAQIGAGFVLNDVWVDRTQREIGEFFEFLLRAEAGIKFMVTDNVSINIEGGYQHVSNADLASRNLGLNCLGMAVGFTYYFGR